MDIYFDEKGLHIGSKNYFGKCIDCDVMDIGTEKYDTKIYYFPGGYTKTTYCSEKLFRVSGFLPNPNPVKRSFNDSDNSDNRAREDNVDRARSRLQQIILCNNWDYFVTFTFDDLKVDASEPSLVIQKLQKWLNNQTSRYGVGYVLVPEYHKKDNRIHCHALVTGDLKVEHNDVWKVQGIKKPVKGDTIKRYHISNERVLYPVYNVSSWRYGFSTAIEVYGNPARLANYVLKYMTKDVHQIFGKNYWCSKNIKLYPDVELVNVGREAYNDLRSREYWMRCAGKSFKYSDNFSTALESMADSSEVEKEVLRL